MRPNPLALRSSERVSWRLSVASHVGATCCAFGDVAPKTLKQLAAQTSKATQLNGVPQARELLERITADVIGVRKARAFLLDRDQSSHPLIQKLVDDRLLHLIKQGYSSKDEPGKRYDVLQIDYGCYVHLLGTASAPTPLIDASVDDK